MTRHMLLSGLLLIALGGASAVHAHPATERYIPIGSSPGISNKYSELGEIQAVDQAERTITMAGRSGRYTVKITERTRIWVDRTQRKRTNLQGTFSDCRVGRTVEVKYADPASKDTAEWIKIRDTAP